jgi:alanyl-tRNA synthetase
MNRKELIEKYLAFFKSKGHKEIPNASLIPKNDPTVLFTTAGMHPIVPYLLSQPHPLGKRLCNVQRCIRTGDIDEVGDEVHNTFFEMLGNWSLGDYFKKEAIEYTFEFHNKVLKIPLEKYAVTVFSGNQNAQRDEESVKVWSSLGIPKNRLAYLEDNWWGPAGNTGPCGPDTEMFFWTGQKLPLKFNPKDKKWVEIGNDVIMQYVKNENGEFRVAEQKNIDFGGGVERTIAVLNGLEDTYLTDCFFPIIKAIENISGKKYVEENKKAMRIIADHIKAAVFIIADGINPSNKEQGYVLRRLIRRAITYGRNLGVKNFVSKVAESVFEIYDDYDILKQNKKRVMEILGKEEERFNQTIEKGINELKKIFNRAVGGIDPEKKSPRLKIFGNKIRINGRELFLLYQSFGLPIEVSQEIMKEWGVEFDEQTMKEAQKEFQIHQELSRTASAGQFKSGLADHSTDTIKLHTAAHLLNAALKIVLKNSDIHQKGSNITPERLRFDFTFPRKLTDKEIKELEVLINNKIKAGLEVIREELNLKEAIKSGAHGEFGTKYPEKVSVYTILDPSEKKGYFSKEICTGPHVKNTKELGRFKITKEESSSSGIRRIKAILE